MSRLDRSSTSAVRPAAARRAPAVAGTFYPSDPVELAALTAELLRRAASLRAAWPPGPRPVGLLVPHAGLRYSGVVAAAAWRLLGTAEPEAPGTVVILGTNHGAGWLDGVGAWDAGSWSTPVGDLAVDEELAAAIVALGPPFGVDRAAHRGEHSIEVQLPLLHAVAPASRIVPLAVSAGTGPAVAVAGERLGRLLAGWRGDAPVHLAISTDMAHYPDAGACERTTRALLPAILALDAGALADAEDAIVRAGIPGLLCGMCGIQPAVLGLAALAAMGGGPGIALAAATSADAGGPRDRTVGYLAAGIPGGPG